MCWKKLAIVCLVVSFASLGVGHVFLNAVYNASGNNDASGGEYVIKTYGKIPELRRGASEWMEYSKKLDAIGDHPAVVDLLYPMFYPEGPIFTYGYGIPAPGSPEISMFVAFKKGEPYDEAHPPPEELMDRIYETFCEAAEEVGVEDVPVRFEIWSGTIELAKERTDPWRPMIGGVYVETTSEWATSVYSAKKEDGTKGYLVAGHFAPEVGTTAEIHD